LLNSHLGEDLDEYEYETHNLIVNLNSLMVTSSIQDSLIFIYKDNCETHNFGYNKQYLFFFKTSIFVLNVFIRKNYNVKRSSNFI